MGAVSFPIKAVAHNWGVGATLSIEISVTDMQTGDQDTEQSWVRTRPAFPGGSASLRNTAATVPPPPRTEIRGPEGSVRFVLPEAGQTVAAAQFPIRALGENWGVETNLFVQVEVRDVDTGQLSRAACNCRTRLRFPGDDAAESY